MSPDSLPPLSSLRTPPSRHIHLDFHTSPGVPDVGADFDAEGFAATLRDARVTSITVFAKCHHGMAYFPTAVGTPYPGLTRDLLGEQIAACHRASIRVAAYISTMYDQQIWRDHPEWRCVDHTGRPTGHRGPAGPLTPNLGRLCLNNPYLDQICAMAQEVLARYEVEGMFFDNFSYGPDGCCCQACMRDRGDLGLDSADAGDRHYHAELVMDRAMERLFATVAGKRPDASVFVNGPLTMHRSATFLRSAARRYRHIEIESLPGGSWGYSHFPMAVRLLRNLGLDTMGMTGAFHRSWGDFGSVRAQAATDYECLLMLAHGAKVSVGDHLHPRGRLNPVTYQRIGRTFGKVELVEEWCADARPVTDIGVLRSSGNGGQSDLGTTTALTQLHHQFDLLDEDADLGGYRLLVIPEAATLAVERRRRLRAYVADGGRLLVGCDHSADDSSAEGTDTSWWDLLGVSACRPWSSHDQYLEPTGDLAADLPSMPHICYEPGPELVTAPGAQTLARYWRGYFLSTYEHFQVEQAPPQDPTGLAAVVATSATVCIGPPVFRLYAQFGYPPYRALLAALIERLLPQPAVDLPGHPTIQATLTRQPRRSILHLLNYVPGQRTPTLDVVDDTPTTVDLDIGVRADLAADEAYLAPDRTSLPVVQRSGYARVRVPRIDGNAMIVFEHRA